MAVSDVQSHNKFFISIWIVFFLLLIAYSIYILITSPGLALNLKPLTDDIVPYVSFRVIVGLYFFIALFNLKKIKNNKEMRWKFLEIRVFDNQIDKAMRDLKRKLATEGTFRELKKRRFYLKPSEAKKLKQKEAEKRRAKARRTSRR